VTNSDWWDRAKLPPRPQPIEMRTRERLCTLRNLSLRDRKQNPYQFYGERRLRSAPG
jgi:hypothetical protein